MTENGELMIKTMLEIAKLYPLLPGLVYRSPYDFVARHGREYLVAAPLLEKWPQRNCFGNAMVKSARDSMRYVEGFALAPTGKAILHAWNLDNEGNVQDVTWANTGAAYVGVEFSVERADDAIWNGDACVLNDEHRGYPIFQKTWIGENWNLAWPASDRLEVLRSGNRELPRSVLEWRKEQKGKDEAK